MKEQTPITAEEFYNEYFKDADKCSVCFWTHEMVEQYAQAKVLEALESEIPKAYETGWCDQNMGMPFEGWDSESTFETRKISYYETEVKPKYI